MANMASVAYAIEGPQKDLEKILGTICSAIADTEDRRWNEYIVCEKLGFSEEYMDDVYLGGECSDPEIVDGVLRFSAEERWGLQDFEELLRQKFPDIKVYWIVEEPGFEIYCTNDADGKYFPERYWVDTCIDGIYNSEYFQFKSSVFKWLHSITDGRVKSDKDVEDFNNNYESSDASEDNFIYIHEFEVV